MTIPISKNLEDIRASLFERISYAQTEKWLPETINLNRGPVRGLIEVWAWGLWQVYSFCQTILNQAFPNLSESTWLDLHSNQVGLQRFPAQRAEGVVFFSRNSNEGNVIIPSSKVVKTAPDGKGEVYRFITLNNTVLPDGENEVCVNVIAENSGAKYNVVAGMINEITTVIPGIDSVRNEAGWLTKEGRDKEIDEQLRERYVLAWQSQNGVTKKAYESWARKIAGVVEVQVIDGHPRGQGTIDIIIRTISGVPTIDVINDVASEINKQKPINDNVLVLAPLEIPVNIVADIYCKPDYATFITDIKQAAIQHISELFQMSYDNCLKIGEDLTIERLISCVMADARVKTVEILEPETIVDINIYSIAVLTDITLNLYIASEL